MVVSVLGAKRAVQNRGIEGKVEKYRPDTFYLNSPDRWFTTTGAEKRPTTRSEEILRPESRTSTTREYFGVGKRDRRGTLFPREIPTTTSHIKTCGLSGTHTDKYGLPRI